jgi:plastocyanin
VRALRSTLTLFSLFLLVACGGGSCPERPAPTPLDRSTTGSIIGAVTFHGDPPPSTPVPMDQTCTKLHSGPVTAGDVLVKDHRVQNAFVYIRDGLGDRVFPQPTTPVEIDQKGCLFGPRVVAAETCQEVVFLNSDPVLHNVHGFAKISSPWNFSLSQTGSRRSVHVEKPETIRVGCDVHAWMQAYVHVLGHPYFAVTGPDGAFTLKDVPPGEYVVTSWHERFGTRDQKVKVGPKEEQAIAFAYGEAGN